MIQKNLSVLVMALVMFVTLVWLGVWQWSRMGWKDSILAQIDQNNRAAPISLQAAIEKTATELGGLNKAEYSKVALSGRYHHDKTLYFFAQQKRQQGWFLYTPLEYQTNYFVFVNRGFIPAPLRPKGNKGQDPSVAEPDKAALAFGLLRMGLKVKISQFILDNNVHKNEYFWRSVRDMAKGAFGEGVYILPKGQRRPPVGFSLKVGAFVLPFTIDLAQNNHKKPWPRAGVTILKPANSHFTYMMTWFSFAITLLIITGFYLAAQQRKE